jgi:hypothetical protein
LLGKLLDVGGTFLLMESKRLNRELFRGRQSSGARSGSIACLMMLFLAIRLGGQPAPPSPQATGRPQPAASVTVGIYLSAISDIDTNRDSFVADFYVWSYSPANASDPLASVSVARAGSQTVLYQWKEKFGDQLWSLRKFRCEISNKWSMWNFPFDRHVLAIAVVPNSDEYVQPVYGVDEKNSGLGNNLALAGWRTENFRVFTQDVVYGSNFGDPHAAGLYQYRAVTASFLLTRKPWGLFFKLMTGAYLAAGAALLGCHMKTDQPPIFSGRMGVQIACLFAAILNHREIGGVLGQRNNFTRLDLLQIAVYLVIFVSLILTLRSRSAAERDGLARSVRLDRRMSLVLAIIFLAFNIAVVVGALITGPNPNIIQVIQAGD